MSTILEHLTKIVFSIKITVDDGEPHDFLVLRIGTVYLLTVLAYLYYFAEF